MVGRAIYWHCFLLKGVSGKFILLFKYVFSQSKFRPYGNLPPEVNTRGVRQGCSLSPFLFNFVIGTIAEIAVLSYEYSDVGIFSDRKLSD